MQEFLETGRGQVVVLALIAFTFALIFVFSDKRQVKQSRALTYSAIAIAIGFVLNQITLFRMPQGGSITPFSMLFIALVGYLFGPRQGILTGAAFGLLDLLINPYVVHPIQMLLDYPLAFGALGLGGILRNKNLIFSYLLGVFGRFICSVVSGVIFFGSAAPESQGALLYSVIYNGSYMGVEALLTCILLAIPAVRNALERVK